MPSEPPTTAPTPATDATSSGITVAQPPTVAANTLSPATSLPPGTPEFVGDYAILSVLGRGGMGVVYKAHDKKLNRVVAIKMLWAGPEASTDDLIRFRGEAELIANLKHPNVVEIYDIGQHDGNPFLVLEYVEGGGLDRRIQGQPQPARHAAELVETLARAMHAVHTQHVMHRDLKPANVLVTASGRYKITDFGLAKRLGDSLGYTRTGDLMGTPSYMAPEQALGKKVDEFSPAIDVYALGAILYELLTGRPPFKGASVPDTLELVRNEEPAAPSRLVPKLHRDLSTICLKCLHKSPARRYATADELADDLRRWLDGDPILARPAGPVERFWVGVKRRPLAASLTVSAVAIVALSVLYGVARREREAELRLQAEKDASRDALQRQSDTSRLAFERQFLHSHEALDKIGQLMLTDARLTRDQRDRFFKVLSGYYDELVQVQSDFGSASPAQMGKAYADLGDLLRQTGQKDRALDAFRNALGHLPAGAAEAAAVRNSVGRLHQESGRLAEARPEYDAALAVLRKAEPTAKVRRLLAEVWHNIGSLVNVTNADKEEALAAYRTARDLRERLAREFPADRDIVRDLARSHGFIGDVELDLGRYTDADRSYWQSHARRLTLAKDPADHEAQFQLGRSFGNFANYQTRLRAYATALDFHRQARELQQTLADRFPAIAEYRADLAGTDCRTAELKLLDRRDAADVLRDVAAAQARYKELLADDPQDATARFGMAEVHLFTATALADADREAVRTALDAARPLLDKLREQRGDPRDFYALAAVHALGSERPDMAPAGVKLKRERAVDLLRNALAKGYRRRHPEDVSGDRALKSLHGVEGFSDFLREYERGPRPLSRPGP